MNQPLAEMFRYNRWANLQNSAEHRTEVKLSLKSIGVETHDLDAWPYSFAGGFGKEVG